MQLKKSFAYRNSAHPGKAPVSSEWSMPPDGTNNPGLEIRFDMGTEERRERLAVYIHKSDFATIAQQMADADREVAIQAFSKALIKSKPVG